MYFPFRNPLFSKNTCAIIPEELRELIEERGNG
jgi:hypothetical protein